MPATLKNRTCHEMVCCLAPFSDVRLEFRMPDGTLVQAEKFELIDDHYEGETLVIQMQPVIFGE